MDRRATPTKRVTSPTRGPPPLCKQAALSASFMLKWGPYETKGAFYGKIQIWLFKSNKRFCVLWANSKTDDESIKSTLWMDSLDHTVQIRIFEITHLSVLFLWGRGEGGGGGGFEKSIYDKRFFESKRIKTAHNTLIPYMYDRKRHFVISTYLFHVCHLFIFVDCF